MRTKLVVGNWKMHMTLAETSACIETFLRHVQAKANVDVAICPPFTALSKARDLLRNTSVLWGAQDVFWKETGAFTGNVSAPMLYDLCCSYCIVGHSETRGRFGKLDVSDAALGYFGETDYTVNLKIRTLLNHAINPILCVGETQDERNAGDTDEVVRRQLAGAFEGIDPAECYFVAVAYEPVWAIGTGLTCDAAEANRVCGYIRECIADLLDADVAQHIRVLYGGSVKPDNAAELFHQPNIDGGLVGGASLDPESFIRIVMSA